MTPDPKLLYAQGPEGPDQDLATKFERVCKLLEAGVITRQDALRLLDMKQEDVCATASHHMHAVLVPLRECLHIDCIARYIMES